MNESYPFPGAPVPGGSRDRRVAALVLVLVVAFVGVAIAKPWGSPPAPAPLASPAAATAALVTPTSVPMGSAEAPGSPTPTPAVPLPLAFTLPAPLPNSAQWHRLRWRQLSPDDPLTLVTAVTRWHGGFVAVGRGVAGDPTTPATPVWTSADGVHWKPVPFNAAGTFWPGSQVVGVAAVPAGLIALTVTARDCATPPCAPADAAPVVAWTSDDGRTWAPHAVPASVAPSGGALRFAGGPTGIVVVAGNPDASVATTSDGMTWHVQAVGAFPSGFLVNDVRRTAAGYVAVGLSVMSDVRWSAASAWSVDGQNWSELPTLLSTSPAPGLSVESAVTSIVAGRNGLIAVGRQLTAPSGELWWQSADGRHWTANPSFAPLGSVTCQLAPCSVEPNGWLVGDGQRLLAGRGGTDGGAWLSADGTSWRRLSVGGDVPDAQATAVILLPGGVLLTDGFTTWFGAPVAP